MKKYIIKISAFIIATFMFLNVNTKSYALSDNVTIEDGKQYLEFLTNKILTDYYGKGYENLDLKTLLEAAYKGMFSVLDDYSEFYTNEEFESYIGDKSGVKYGMGATVQKNSYGAIIVSLTDDGSAKEAGMQVNDIITKVDGVDVSEMTLEEIVSLVTGEEGTKVTLIVNRAGNILSFTIERRKVKDNPVSYFLLNEYTKNENDSETVYIALDSFNEIAYESFYNVFEENENIKNVILDLRNNSGGYTDQALKICSFLLCKDDEILTLKDKEGNETTYSSKSDSHIDKIVVLINKNSASASEVTTGALKDNNRAIVIGENSYGKNVSQTIYNYNELKFKLTEEVYFTPSGESVLGKGITPDIIIETPNFITDVKYKYYGGEESEDILKVKSMLKYLGYNVTDFTNKYDSETFKLVQAFQRNNGLGDYGGIDYTTQRTLNQVAYAKYSEKDEQFEKAIEVINNYDKYFNELGKNE